ncbi:MAG: hypothetical protein BWZ01_02738 [Deltaproteobacteria bacterium ADurb.BinA179]|nr:MAG: hypothetical protein BWZ01_02738 [Deltaproteobacteria bacterium ADurb.BinA179]
MQAFPKQHLFPEPVRIKQCYISASMFLSTSPLLISGDV